MQGPEHVTAEIVGYVFRLRIARTSSDPARPNSAPTSRSATVRSAI